MNLFSVGQLTDRNCTVSFDSSSCVVQDRLTGRQIGTGHRLGGLDYMDRLHIGLVINRSKSTVFASKHRGTLLLSYIYYISSLILYLL